MSATQGLDVEECKDLITFEDLEGWDVTCLIASVSLIVGQLDYSVNWNRMYRKVMRSGLLALGIFDTFECGGASTAKEGGTARTLDDFAEDAGRRCHFGRCGWFPVI